MRLLVSSCLFILCMHSVSAGPEVKEDNLHIRTWNQFAENILKFHQQRIKNKNIVIKEKLGGYFGQPDFYLQKDYFEEGKHIATVMWEREKPEQLHSIEVFIHDKQGRVTRDYTAAYLPNYHNAPTQTLISLHRYNNGLHAFRSFDASGYRIIERCSGNHQGKEVELLLDEDEIAVALDDAYIKKGVMMSSEYKNCFSGLQQDVGEFITPQ